MVPGVRPGCRVTRAKRGVTEKGNGTMQETVQLYVGADNDTHDLDLERIGKIMSSNHEGYTIWPAEGSWRGVSEPSAVILVNDDHDSIMATVAQLKSELRQDAIGYQRMPDVSYA